ncbi:DUF1523 family protein [Frigidibacter oleivorans]|uniref:DUF1523 family protein n=1 Tax=Frigidibacter oleivorans TaxID=2487129 RepID=UPI000F8E2A81|nr:DUF1523 family protein [Frigidibacter oleivorans]
MRYVKWGLAALAALIVALFLHYTLPRHDTVRITDTYNRLTTLGSNRIFYASADSGTGAASTGTGGETRDILFIQAVRPNGRVVVYRNEDTGWVWPPYFKYDSSNLQAEAANLRSDAGNPQWAIVTRYGWRIPFLSAYPNAVAIRAVDGPVSSGFPWLNTVILVMLALLVLVARRMWLQFRERTLDPIFRGAGDRWDRVEDRADTARRDARTGWGRFRARLRGLFR